MPPTSIKLAYRELTSAPWNRREDIGNNKNNNLSIQMYQSDS